MRYALELDYDGVHELVEELSDGPCPWQSAAEDTAELVAMLGDDGRSHLIHSGSLRCTSVPRRRRDRPLVGHQHAQWCRWWTDGHRLRVNPPPLVSGVGVEGTDGSITASWLVRLTGFECDPAEVPIRRRCPVLSAVAWPAHRTMATSLGRVRAVVVEALGPGCHACREQRTTVVDHDHFTGLVRGLLCVYCNGHIDSCCHLAGCPWADYLNNPPAAELRVRYPSTTRSAAAKAPKPGSNTSALTRSNKVEQTARDRKVAGLADLAQGWAWPQYAWFGVLQQPERAL